MEQYTNPKNFKKGKIIGSGYVIGNLNTKRKGYLCGRFEGVNKALEYITKNEGKFGNLTRYTRSSKSTRNSDWTKFSDYDASVKALRHHPEVFRDFDTRDVKILDHDNSGNDVEYGVTGDYLDIGAYMTGEPEVFGSLVNGKASNRFVKILVNGGLQHKTTEAQIHKRGRGIATLVDSLEAQNIRVEVTVIYHTETSHLEIVVKKYDEQLNIDEVCSAVSAEMFRRIYFLWSEHSASHLVTYGRERSIVDEIKTDTGETTIVIDSGLTDWDKYGGGIENVFEKLFETVEKTEDIRSKLFYTSTYGRIAIKEV